MGGWWWLAWGCWRSLGGLWALREVFGVILPPLRNSSVCSQRWKLQPVFGHGKDAFYMLQLGKIAFKLVMVKRLHATFSFLKKLHATFSFLKKLHATFSFLKKLHATFSF